LAPAVLAQPREEALPPGALARLGEVRYRNVGRVFSLAFSPDGKILAAGAWDGSIRLWDVATRRELRQCVGHSGWVRSVVFFPDGKTLASGGKDKVIRLWDTATGKELRQFKGHQNWVQHLVLSSDGKILGSQSNDQTLRLWDVATGRELRQIEVRPFIGKAMAFSPDGKQLAYIARDPHTVTLEDCATGKETRRITRGGSWIQHVSFSPDSKILIGVSSPEVLLWNVATGKDLQPLDRQQGAIDSTVFSWDGRSMISAEGHRLRLWELSSRRQRGEFRSPDRNIAALAYSPDGRLLAQGSEDISVVLWDLTGRLEKGQLRPAALSPKELQARWADLAGDDPVAAYRAIWTLAAAAPQSLLFLQEQIRPVPPLAPAEVRRVQRLLAELDSEQFAIREQATKQLEKLAERAEPTLREALGHKPPLETRQRIERLLEKLSAEWEKPSPSCLRLLRALEAVECMDTPAAQQFLQRLANGTADVELTGQAKAALGRLAKH
jgi:hypothetical protein